MIWWSESLINKEISRKIIISDAYNYSKNNCISFILWIRKIPNNLMYYVEHILSSIKNIRIVWYQNVLNFYSKLSYLMYLINIFSVKRCKWHPFQLNLGWVDLKANRLMHIESSFYYTVLQANLSSVAVCNKIEMQISSDRLLAEKWRIYH